MSGRTAALLAWCACALSLALTAMSLLLLTLTVFHPDVPVDYYWLENTAAAVGYSTVGAILASRLPQSPIGWVWWAGLVLTVVGLAGNPIGMGVAIFRYRLYQIDLLINRTLVYGSLTATLVALYFGGIVLLQRRVFVAITGEKSTLAVIASTLLIAALFNP
jgi:hypothetical protein